MVLALISSDSKPEEAAAAAGKILGTFIGQGHTYNSRNSGKERGGYVGAGAGVADASGYRPLSAGPDGTLDLSKVNFHLRLAPTPGAEVRSFTVTANAITPASNITEIMNALNPLAEYLNARPTK